MFRQLLLVIIVYQSVNPTLVASLNGSSQGACQLLSAKKETLAAAVLVNSFIQVCLQILQQKVQRRGGITVW